MVANSGKISCAGVVKRLRPPLIHHPVARLEDALSRMDRYSTASAEVIVAAGRKVSFMTGIGHGLYSFLRTYVLRAGFLDGREGFMLAVSNAEGAYYRYLKLMLLTEKHLYLLLGTAAVWRKRRGKRSDDIFAPAAVRSMVLTDPELPLPYVDRITTAPVFGDDGSLTLAGLASDERSKGADDFHATQGDLAVEEPSK